MVVTRCGRKRWWSGGEKEVLEYGVQGRGEWGVRRVGKWRVRGVGGVESEGSGVTVEQGVIDEQEVII